MTTSTSTISTSSGSLYMRKLCKHWAHKFETTVTETTGKVIFGPAKQVTFAATPTHLTLTLTAPAEDSARMQEVVTEHLQRFAFKEPLTISWQNS